MKENLFSLLYHFNLLKFHTIYALLIKIGQISALENVKSVGLMREEL